MAEWIVCPACKLKHAARPDGACPRCKQPIGGASSAGATDVALPTSTPGLHSEGIPEGARIAAWVLYGNAVVSVLALLLTGIQPTEPAGLGSLGPLVVDVVLATSLLRGSARWVGWALVRAVLGGLILTPILWSNAGPAMGMAQLLYSLGLILLLAGRPGLPRIVGGLVPSAGTLVLLLAVIASPGVARRVRAVAADVVDRGHLVQLEGTGGWRLQLPEGTWHPGKAAKGIDRMVSWPEEDAHLMVISQAAAAGAQLDVFRATDVLMEGMRKAEPSLAELERRSFRARRGSGVAVHATLKAKGHDAEGWYVVFVDGNRLAVAIALGPRERFAEIGDGLLAVAEQLEL